MSFQPLQDVFTLKFFLWVSIGALTDQPWKPDLAPSVELPLNVTKMAQLPIKDLQGKRRDLSQSWRLENRKSAPELRTFLPEISPDVPEIVEMTEEISATVPLCHRAVSEI